MHVAFNYVFIFLFTGKTYDVPCKKPVEKPPFGFGYGISDHEIAFSFMKPINNDYDYLAIYKTTGSPQLSFAYFTTYGPIWADALVNLQPNKFYTIGVVLLCAYNSSIRSSATMASTNTRTDCKLVAIYQC